MKNIVLLIVIAITGCSSIRNPFSDGPYSGISPPRIHVEQREVKNSEPIKSVTNEILEAEKRPYLDYYEALKKAEEAKIGLNNEAIFRDYIDKGIGVVNASCLRWFTNLAESSIRFEYLQSNQNVIQNLGTTLLGFGKANSIITGTFGAIFTGLNGWESNISQTFLLAPNTNKVKDHIFMALDSRATELLKDIPQTFSKAYRDLERYADICTQQTAKEIVNSSLDQTNSSVSNAEGGKVQTTVTKAAESASVIEVKTQYDAKIASVDTELQNLKSQLLEAQSIKATVVQSIQAENESLKAQLKQLQEENTVLKKSPPEK